MWWTMTFPTNNYFCQNQNKINGFDARPQNID